MTDRIAPWLRTELSCEKAQQLLDQLFPVGNSKYQLGGDKAWQQSRYSYFINSSHVPKIWGWLRTHDMIPAFDWRGFYFSREKFIDADFRTADFFGVDMDEKTFICCDFRGCNFTDAVLTNGVFDKCDFSGAMLHGTKTEGSKFTGCRFLGADLSHSGIKSVIDADCDLTGADLFEDPNLPEAS